MNAKPQAQLVFSPRNFDPYFDPLPFYSVPFSEVNGQPGNDPKLRILARFLWMFSPAPRLRWPLAWKLSNELHPKVWPIQYNWFVYHAVNICR